MPDQIRDVEIALGCHSATYPDVSNENPSGPSEDGGCNGRTASCNSAVVFWLMKTARLIIRAQAPGVRYSNVENREYEYPVKICVVYKVDP